MRFIPAELIHSVQANGLNPAQDMIKMRLQRLVLPQRFSDLRELFASYSVKHLRQPKIDFSTRTDFSVSFHAELFQPLMDFRFETESD